MADSDQVTRPLTVRAKDLRALHKLPWQTCRAGWDAASCAPVGSGQSRWGWQSTGVVMPRHSARQTGQEFVADGAAGGSDDIGTDPIPP